MPLDDTLPCEVQGAGSKEFKAYLVNSREPSPPGHTESDATGPRLVSLPFFPPIRGLWYGAYTRDPDVGRGPPVPSLPLGGVYTAWLPVLPHRDFLSIPLPDFTGGPLEAHPNKGKGMVQTKARTILVLFQNSCVYVPPSHMEAEAPGPGVVGPPPHTPIRGAWYELDPRGPRCGKRSSSPPTSSGMCVCSMAHCCAPKGLSRPAISGVSKYGFLFFKLNMCNRKGIRDINSTSYSHSCSVEENFSYIPIVCTIMFPDREAGQPSVDCSWDSTRFISGM